jgi:ABC-2 type transport system permease protein
VSGDRWRRQRLALAVGLLLLLCVLVLSNLLVAQYPRRFDWTRQANYTLSDKTKQVLRSLAGQVTVTLFMADSEGSARQLHFETRELLRRFSAMSSRVDLIELDIDHDSSRAAMLMKRYEIRPADVSEGVVVFSRGNRSRYVRASQLARFVSTPEGHQLVSFQGEAMLLGALLSVTTDQQALVCFSTGHGEAPIDNYEERGYATIADELRRDNHGVKAVGPADWPSSLRGCEVLVIGGPTRGFAPGEARGLERYLRAGGRLLLLSGPLLDRRVTRFRELGLETVLRRWGIGLGRNVVVDPLSVPGEQPLLTWATEAGYGSHPIGRALRGYLTVWPLARQVKPIRAARSDLEVWRIVSSSERGWAETDLASLRGDAPLAMDPEVDIAGPVPVAVAARAGHARIVVLGSERGMINKRLEGDVRRDFNRDLFLTTISWLIGEAQTVAVGPKSVERMQLAIDNRIVSRVFLLTVVGLPALALCIGLIVWFRRRR